MSTAFRSASSRRLLTGVVCGLLVTGSAVVPERVRAVSTTVVISEFRVRGPAGGNDEFVELYNVSSVPVNIGGWRIQGSNSGGTVSTRATVPAGTMLAPGCHFLATNTAASGYSGAVPGNVTYGTGITDDGGIALTMADNTVIDQVGMSAGSAFGEGARLSSLGTSNQNRSMERRPGGGAGSATDTDDNAADFQLIGPSDPQNLTSTCITGGSGPSGVGTAHPASVLPGGAVLLTVAVTEGAPPQPISSVLANLSAVGGVSGAALFDDGTNGDVTAGDLVYSLATAVAPATSPGSKTLPVTITDAGLRTGATSIALTVAMGPTPFVAIHDIQGTGAVSPLAGQLVETEGIVTARRLNTARDAENGFFLQAAVTDADPASSEAVFVFTGAPPPAIAAVGSLVRVTGRVTEFVPAADPNSAPVTEITSPAISLVSAGNPMPAAVLLTAAIVHPDIALDALERFESMRVRVDELVVVAPTNGSVAEASATSTSDGIFFGVIQGIARPFRQPGVALSDPLPAGSPAGVLRFDNNPERLRIDSGRQSGAALIDVASGAVLSGVVGVLDYAFRNYSILPDPAPSPTVTGQLSAVAVRVPAADEFTVASANLERFFDTTNDPGVGDVVLTPAAFDRRLSKFSLLVRNVLRTPDILAVQEVDNLPTLEAMANRVNADATAAGLASPAYVPYLEEGNDPGGIDVGFLVKSTRVAVVSVIQIGKADRFVDVDGSLDILHDRPPLVLRADVGAAPQSVAITVIVNHLRSLNDIGDPTAGPRVRAKRRAQAEALASLIQSRQASERVIAVGDFNAFEFSDGYVDVIGTILGIPSPASEVVLSTLDLVDPDLISLGASVPAAQRYSYVFDGNAQVLDHVLVTSSTLPLVAGLEWARTNADFPETMRQDDTRPERLSDHDPAVAYFRLPPPPCSIDVTTSVSVTRGGFVFDRATKRFVQQLTVQNTGAAPIAGQVAVALDGLSAGATLANSSGPTACALPAGSPTIVVNVGSDGVLGPGEAATAILQFVNPANGAIAYGTRVLSGVAR